MLTALLPTVRYLRSHPPVTIHFALLEKSPQPAADPCHAKFGTFGTYACVETTTDCATGGEGNENQNQRMFFFGNVNHPMEQLLVLCLAEHGHCYRGSRQQQKSSQIHRFAIFIRTCQSFLRNVIATTGSALCSHETQLQLLHKELRYQNCTDNTFV